jgi:hypothetical protein
VWSVEENTDHGVLFYGTPTQAEKVAKILKVPAEAIKNFSDQSTINIIANTVTNHDNGS